MSILRARGLAAILACLTHGTHLVHQATLLKNLLAPNEPPAATFGHSRNMASTSCGPVSPSTRRIAEGRNDLEKDPQNFATPHRDFQGNFQLGILLLEQKELIRKTVRLSFMMWQSIGVYKFQKTLRCLMRGLRLLWQRASNPFFKKRISLEEQTALTQVRFLRGRQVPYMICQHFRVIGAHEDALDLTDLFSVHFYNATTFRILMQRFVHHAK